MTRTRPWTRRRHERPRDDWSASTPGGLPVEHGSPETLRLFVAIELAPALIEELTAVQARLREVATQLRWVRPEGIHLTLKFLGNVPAERLQATARALLAVEGTASVGEIRLARPGTFDGRSGPRVLWCGVAGDLGGLGRLAAAIDAALARVGFDPEAGPYRPHLTLARFPDAMARAEREGIAKQMNSIEVQPIAMRPRDFTLFSSRLGPEGSVHTPVHRFELAV
jgi:2'-5' RNA ligase